MPKPEYRLILQRRDLEETPPKWRNVDTSEAFGEYTLTDYDAIALRCVLESYDDRIRRDLAGNWP